MKVTYIENFDGISEDRIITWTDGSQYLFEKSWFLECELINSEKGIKEYGSCAFIIPENRVKDL